MSATHTWLLVVAGHAVMLAWPVFTVALASFAARYTAARSVRSLPAAGTAEALPTDFWIVVPALNEQVVVGNTVAAALSLVSPVGTLSRVLVVDDGSDDNTPHILAGISHPRLHVLRRDLPDARRGKGEALNAAYRWITARAVAEGVDPDRVVLGIIDGDGQGSRNILIEVSRKLRDARVGAVQCQVRIRNRHEMLGTVQDLEFGAIVSAFQTMRDRLGTVGLGGNGQFTRLSALQTLGDAPWSACLVEDLELGLRLHLSGHSIRYTSRAAVTQQAVVDVRRLVRQRTRWAQGNIQCARYLGRLCTARRLSPAARAEMLHYLLSPWLNALMMLVMLVLAGAGTVGLCVGEPLPYLRTWADLATTAALWLGATYLPGVIWSLVHRRRLGDQPLWLLLSSAAAYPAFLLMCLVATYRAVFRQATGRQTWAKTERLSEDPVADVFTFAAAPATAQAPATAPVPVPA
ncbi:hypothetical protein GCM10010124_35460 [Pilimelia terevasa]|uniref:N-acetyl-glucosamine transferase n=1 Tax=Pilimelia terevasa TaxID=53372 RepID=A0A8J3BQ29_9ACTN|nr:glycosyltransferase family 2 protein [Pilimelia terevasa]GGK39750.1 hypothetical protein GCM10010124_35460 [Pilimelia terevasa]